MPYAGGESVHTTADTPVTDGQLSREHLELLYRFSLECNSTLDADELLPRVFERVLEVLDAEAGSIWLVQGDQVVCQIARGPVAEKIEGLELPIGAGIVGDVALTGQAELVEDARDDPRFVHQVDESTGFATESMAAAPLKTQDDEVLGVIQVLNKRSGSGRFDAMDLELLTGLASDAGGALHNAQLHEAEKRARDLEALLEISREVASTLEVDRLIMSAVNLGSRVLSYDRAAIALDEGGSPELRAVSGQETLDARSDANRELGKLIGWLLERGGIVYVPDLRADDDPAPAIRAAFPAYSDSPGSRSLCLIPLQDEEGRLGGLFMDSSTPGFLSEGGREAAELLANQISVSLRNADLYGQVPLIGLLEPLAAWKRKVTSMPRARAARRYLLPAAIILAVSLIPWSERISPREAVLIPTNRMPLRATVDGLIEAVLVQEGDVVEAGQVVARLRDDDIRMQISEADAAYAGFVREAASARASGAEARARIAEVRIEELGKTVTLLHDRLERTRLVAPVGGAVLTLRPDERLGEWLTAGETFVVIGATDRLEVEARVAQYDISRVEPGQDVRLKVAARPRHMFVGTVTNIAAQADAPDGGVPTVVVRADVDNSHGLLRPGMEARAKIVGARRPLGYLVLRPFGRWIQMHLWR
jgi:GAF domain-containing protein